MRFVIPKTKWFLKQVIEFAFVFIGKAKLFLFSEKTKQNTSEIVKCYCFNRSTDHSETHQIYVSKKFRKHFQKSFRLHSNQNSIPKSNFNPHFQAKKLTNKAHEMQVLNVLLRLAWMQTVLNLQVSFLNRQTLIALVAVLEINQRGIWNFFR